MSNNYIIVDSNYSRRQKLFSGEKNRIAVVPEDFSKNDFSVILTDKNLVTKYENSFNIFCAGDFVKNAFIDELKAFASFNWFYNKNCYLFIVMQDSNYEAEEKIRNLAEQLGIDKKLVLVQASDKILAKSLFDVSSIFISLNDYSENRVYCYEAMNAGKIVISSAEGKLPELLNGSGIIVTEKQNDILGSLLNQLFENSVLVKTICDEEKKQFKLYEENVRKYDKTAVIQNLKENGKSVVFENSDAPVEYPDVKIFDDRIPLCYELDGQLNLLKFGKLVENIDSLDIAYLNSHIDGIGVESDCLCEKLIEHGVIIPVKKIENDNWNDFIEEVFSVQKKISVSMVTTWNSRCGIAEYTKMEVEASLKNIDYEIFPNQGVELLQKDELFVQPRTWIQNYNEDFETLTEKLLASKSEFVHIQFHYGLFQNLARFAAFVENLVSSKKVVITFHKTADNDFITRVESLRTIVASLNKCTALVVHAESDRKRLLDYGVTALIKVIEHGQIVYPDIAAAKQKAKLGIDSSVVVGSYGFLIPHKGILEAIQSIAILKKDIPDILYMPVCSLSGGKDSQEYFGQCSAEIERLGLQDNVRMITDFLPNDESMKYLKACDVMVMPYKPTQESASGAVRFCVAAARPMITSKQKIFDEFKSCAYQIDETKPELIADGIKQALNPSIRDELVRNEKSYMMKTSWYSTAKKFYQLYSELQK